MTYGAFVSQIIKDTADVQEANKQLEKIGMKMGTKLVEEFLAKSGIEGCSSFRETADVIAKVAFKMFLGVQCEVINYVEKENCFSLIMSDNPLIDFVELPKNLQGLYYSNLICGVIKGALEAIHFKVNCYFVKDILRGDDTNEIKVELKGIISFKSDED